jgi:hypothetical protein
MTKFSKERPKKRPISRPFGKAIGRTKSWISQNTIWFMSNPFIICKYVIMKVLLTTNAIMSNF